MCFESSVSFEYFLCVNDRFDMIPVSLFERA